MKIDVLIEYDAKNSKVAFSSSATRFWEKRPATIGLSHSPNTDYNHGFIEFVGEDQKGIEIIKKEHLQQPSRKGHILRIVNPFESNSFEPFALFCMIRHFSTYIFAQHYPKTWEWRQNFSWLDKYEITLKIPDYQFFEPMKKMEFEKMLKSEYKRVTFVSQ